METVRNPRCKGKEIALALGRSGRSATISSATRQLSNMYKSKVSFTPHLILKNYNGFERTAYFCAKKGKKGATNIFLKLYKRLLKKEISSVMYLAGHHDFFITSRMNELDFKSIGLEVQEKTSFFDPIFPIPYGWKKPMRKCIQRIGNSQFTKNRLNRKNYDELDWQNKEWKIYRSIRANLRKSFKSVGEDVGISSFTVKKILNEKVLPRCIVANYFFPLGYKHYDKIFIRLKSEYEKSIISSLKNLPCTTYVYPLQDEIILILFYENIKDIFVLTRKIEEKGLAEDLVLYIPLASAP